MGGAERAVAGVDTPIALRFSVASSDRRRSMAWRVWTGDRRPSDEVYVAPRHMAGDLKFSAHGSGYTQIGPTERMRTRSSPDDRHALSRALLEPGDGRVVLRLLFHRSELRPREPAADEVTIDMHDDEDALQILVTVGPLPDHLPAGCRTVGSVTRRSTEPAYLIAGPSHKASHLLAEALEGLRAPYQTWRMPVDWADEQHGVMVASDGSAGPPVLVEFANDDPPPDRVLPAALERTFPGQVFLFDELPVPHRARVDLCAAIWIDKVEHVRIYVNDQARCDHAHLGADVARLVAAFKKSGPDGGWTPMEQYGVERGGWITAVVTRTALEREQAPC